MRRRYTPRWEVIYWAGYLWMLLSGSVWLASLGLVSALFSVALGLV